MESGKRIEGTVRSQDRVDAIRKVRELGYHPVDVTPAAADRTFRFSSEQLRRVTVTDLAVFTRQLASLLKAGLPMVKTLSTLRQQCPNPRLKIVIQDIEESLSRDGGTLADAMEDHPKIFNPVYRGLVRAGEEGGQLVRVLFDMAQNLSKAARLRGQVVGAFIYPIFLMLLGSAAVFVLISFVIPQFQELFESFNQQLPLPTVVLIAVSDFMGQWWWAVLALTAAVCGMIYMSLQKADVREVFDRRLLKLPILGQMLMKLEIARIARTLGALIDSGVRILDALRITGDTAKNLAIQKTFPLITKGVAAGETLADLLDRTAMYPPMVINLVRTGEETGELPEMLDELSSIYEDEAERAVTSSVKLLEPLLIVVMGGIIASIVAAVIMPIFQANAMVE